MSAHIDIKSESVSHTEEVPSPVHAECPSPMIRRVTLFENVELVQKLTPELIAAIQRELVDQRVEFERQTEKRVTQLLTLAARERIDMERLRLEGQNRWEEVTGSTAQSRSSKSPQ